MHIPIWEFEKLDKEVQKEFTDWWKIENFDPYYDNYSRQYGVFFLDPQGFERSVSRRFGEYGKVTYNRPHKGAKVPVLNKNFLMEFIEDKMKTKLSLVYHTSGYTFKLKSKRIKTSETDLLKALLEVAIQIIKGKVVLEE